MISSYSPVLNACAKYNAPINVDGGGSGYEPPAVLMTGYWKGILIRGGFERLVDEAERNLTDALSVVSDVIENPFIVPGGGAPEVEAAKAVRQLAAKVSGREQYAIEAFANALEAVPKTLAENAGLDAVDILTELRHMHESREDGWKYGIDAFSGKVADMVAMNIIEPLVVKTQAYKAAVEATSMILRIDEIIAASKIESGGEKGKKEGEEGAGSTGGAGGLD